MIGNIQVLCPALGAVLLGVTLAGCGNTAQSTEGTTASSGTTAQTTTATAPATTGDAPGTSAAARSEAPAELAAFFPGATLTKKAFPLGASDAAHLSGMGKVKFSGKESEWEVYEASQSGARAGYAVMTHSDLPGGGDMHIAFAVDKSFKVSAAKAVEAPDAAKMDAFVAQMEGKSHDAAFKVGQDLKAAAGLPSATAQIASDAVHKGMLILEENFNAAHGADSHGADSHEHGEHAAGHKDDGHTH